MYTSAQHLETAADGMKGALAVVFWYKALQHSERQIVHLSHVMLKQTTLARQDLPLRYKADSIMT